MARLPFHGDDLAVAVAEIVPAQHDVIPTALTAVSRGEDDVPRDERSAAEVPTSQLQRDHVRVPILGGLVPADDQVTPPRSLGDDSVVVPDNASDRLGGVREMATPG